MELTRQAIEIEKWIGGARVQTRVIAETATPGAGREEIRVLMEEAQVAIDSAEAQEGRIVVDGAVTCQAVYRQGDAAAARAVAAQTRVSEVIEMEGVTARSIVRARGAVEAVEAAYDNGRMRFEVLLSLTVQALELVPIQVITEISGVEGLQTRFVEICSKKLSAQASEDALLTQEVALPAQLDARVSLMDWSSAHVLSTEPDLGGVRVKGEVQAEALIGTGVEARPVALVKVMMPFDQLVEMPEWLTGDVTASARATQLSTSVVAGTEEEGAKLVLEAQVRVEAFAGGEDCARALEDAYGLGEEAVAVETESIDVCTGTVGVDCQEAFRGALLLPDGAPGVGAVLATRVRPVVENQNRENGETVIEGVLDVKAIYLPGGSERVESARGELPFVLHCREDLPDSCWTTVEATPAEATALMSDRLEIKCGLRVHGFYRATTRVGIAQEVEETRREKRDGGLVIVWPGESDTAWSVAKRYALPQERVGDVKPGAPMVLRV